MTRFGTNWRAIFLGAAIGVHGTPFKEPVADPLSSGPGSLAGSTTSGGPTTVTGVISAFSRSGSTRRERCGVRGGSARERRRRFSLLPLFNGVGAGRPVNRAALELAVTASAARK